MPYFFVTSRAQLPMPGFRTKLDILVDPHVLPFLVQTLFLVSVFVHRHQKLKFFWIGLTCG